jgi:hypothetical protein
MKETDKEYYTRRGNEERSRARTAATIKAQSIHGDLADLCHERANGSANVNRKKGIRDAQRPASRISRRLVPPLLIDCIEQGGEGPVPSERKCGP